MTETRSESPRPMLVALTGGVASGKTAVSDRLGALGVPIVDTDQIAREVVAPGSRGLAAVAEAFGQEVLTAEGALDRQALRQSVFDDPGQRERLEGILHPLIEREARRRVADCPDSDYVVIVVPLLVETGLFPDAERVVVVDVPESVQLERLVARDEIDDSQARAMLEAQASRNRRLKAATDVIENTGSLDALDEAVRELHRRLVAVSRRRRAASRRPR